MFRKEVRTVRLQPHTFFTREEQKTIDLHTKRRYNNKKGGESV